MDLTEETAPDRTSMVLDDDGPSRREKAAFHEAGHIAVAWALQATLYETDIRHDPPFNGRAVYGITGDIGASVERIIATLAGPTAQRRFAPREDDCGGEDRERAAQHLIALCRHEAAATIVLRHCQAEASRLVAVNWDAVEAVAAALLDREFLTGDELNAILADVAFTRSRRGWAELLARTRTGQTTPTRFE